MSTVNGSSGNDTITTGSTNDEIFGNGGADSITSGGGDDRVDAGSGNDTIFGGDGADRIDGNADNDLIHGDGGNDELEGDSGNDTIFGGAGEDDIDGEGGDDSLHGGEGNNTVDGGTGNDTITAGSGADQLFGGDGTDSITGGAGNDTLEGGSGADWLAGGDGNDQVKGGTGADTIIAGTGQDTLEGNEDADIFIVGNGFGASQIQGGDGVTTGGTDTDTLDLSGITGPITITFNGAESGSVSDGTRTLTFTGIERVILGSGQVTMQNRNAFVGQVETATVVVDGTAGNDTMGPGYTDAQGQQIDGNDGTAEEIQAYGGNDRVTAGQGNDTVYGGTGNDTVDGGDGRDLVFGGDGQDVLQGGLQADTLHGDGGNDVLDGGAETDSLYGGAGSDSLYGGDGNDLMDGGDGDDLFLGGNGNDTMWGGAGSDVFQPGEGADSIQGGAGNDTITLSDNDTIDGGADFDLLDGSSDTAGRAYVFTSGTGGTAGSNSFRNIEWFRTGSGDDTVNAWWAESGLRVETGDGNDYVQGGTGGDTVFGDAGSDTLGGDWGNDTLYGGSGDDVLEGHDDADALYGGDGGDYIVGFDVAEVTYGGNRTLDPKVGSDDGADDLLDGGAGRDTLLGGGGRDTIRGGTDDDIALGGDGDDQVSGGMGSDRLYGGAGDDTLRGDADGRDPREMASVNGKGGEQTFLLVNKGDAPVDLYWVNYDGQLEYYATVKPGMAWEQPSFDGHNWAVTDPESGEVVTYLEDPSGEVVLHADMADDMEGGSGNDAIFGGAGADTLTGGTGDDSLSGGAGEDVARFSGSVQDYAFDYGPGGTLIVTDSVAGRDGQDTLDGVEFVDFGGVTYRLIQGDDGGNTTLQGPDDGTPSLIIAHDGNDWGGGHATSDAVFGGAGNDTLDGGDGDDTLSGDGGDDLLRGDGGDDRLFGGDGADTLQGGTGDDSLSGGAGDDRFDLDRASGTDTVSDFDMTVEDGRTADQLDVSDLRTPAGDPITWRDVVVTDTNGDGTGDAVLTFPEGESVVLVGVTPDQVDSKQQMAAIGIPCFVRGTPILTPGGWRAVEQLVPGDLVQTDDGPRPVIWAGARRVSAAEMAARPGLAPVRFDAGAIGNARPLRLSPQHAVVLLQADGAPVLVRARHLAEAGLPGVRATTGQRAVSYHHILLDRHAVVFAAGAPVESLYPGRQALAAMAMPARLRIAAAIRCKRGGLAGFPSLGDLTLAYGPRVHPLIGRRAAMALCARRLAVIARAAPIRCA